MSQPTKQTDLWIDDAIDHHQGISFRLNMDGMLVEKTKFSFWFLWPGDDDDRWNWIEL